MGGCENIEAKASSGRPDHCYMFVRYFVSAYTFLLLLRIHVKSRVNPYN